MHPYLCIDKKNTLSLKRTLPNKEIQIKQLSLLYHPFEGHLGMVFISLPEISIDASLWEETSSSTYILRSYHWGLGHVHRGDW